jgi:thiosulfate reductase / polysulfide reductase chain A
MNRDRTRSFGISRRGFMKLGGMGTVALLLGPRFRFEDASAQDKVPGVFTVNTVCQVCSGGCAVKAMVRDGRLVELRGNPDDQVARGVLCVKGISAIQTLYDPDRIKFPMKRTNPEKGPGVDPKFVRISWDEAYSIIAEKLNGYKEKYGPESISFVMRPNPFAQRLANAIGTPNYVSHHNTCYSTHEVAWRATMTGSGKPWTQDYANAKYILSFGWDMPGKAKNMQTQGFLEAKAKGAKIVTLDPLHTVTASKSDMWIPIKPGTDLAFALAMINVIVNEGLYDKQFVSELTTGFDKLQAFIKPYTPKWAAGITELPEATIVKVARDFAAAKPAIIATHKRDAAGPNYANSWRLAHAQVILMALNGSLDRPGGHIVQRGPKFPSLGEVYPAPEFPKKASARVDGMEQFPILNATGKGSFSTYINAILDEKPYPVKAAIVRKHNILAFTDAPLATKALKKLDFLVVMDIIPSEMVQMADIVLPDHQALEGSAIVPRGYFALYPQIAVQQPVVKPLYETRGFRNIMIEMGKAMGLGDYFKDVSPGGYDDACMKAVGSSLEAIKQSPNGLWGEPKPFVPKTEFNTPSKKIEIYASEFEKHGYDPLPAWQEKSAKPSKEFPLYFVTTRPSVHIHSTTQNQVHNADIYPENRCYINTNTAKSLNVKDGGYVWVESPLAKIKVQAKVTEGIRPDTVAVDHGFGHWSKALTKAYGKGSNEGDLVPSVTHKQMVDAKDPSMSMNMSDICVKVYSA